MSATPSPGGADTPSRFRDRPRVDADSAPAPGAEQSAEARRQQRLADLVGFAGEAAYLVGRTGAVYLGNTAEGAALRSAGQMVIIRVATVVEKLPAEFKDRHPGIAWVDITRMRKLVAHHYDKVGDPLIWAALNHEIPKLLADLGLMQ